MPTDAPEADGTLAWVATTAGSPNGCSIAAVAAAHHLEVSGRCAPHLHAHVAAATPNLCHLEWFHDHARIEQMVFDGTLDPAGDAVRPDPAALGNGLSLRREAAERYRKDLP